MPKIREDKYTGLIHVQFDGSDEHPVNLFDEEFPGNGSCLCTDFQCRCAPNFIKHRGKVIPYWKLISRKPTTATPDPNRTVCRHLEAARNYYWPKILKEWSKYNAPTGTLYR